MNKSAFLAKGIQPKKVMIPSIDAEVFVRPMSYAASVAISEAETALERTLVAVIMGLVDKTGKALFTMDEKEELASAMTYQTIQEIAAEILGISSIGSDNLVK